MFKLFSDIPYQRPDFADIRRQIKRCNRTLRHAGDYASARRALMDYETLLKSLETATMDAHIRNTIDTADKFYEAEYQAIVSGSAKLMPLMKQNSRLLAGSPFRKDFEQEFGQQLFRVADANIRVNHWRNIRIGIRESNLGTAYSKLTAGSTCLFHGERCNFYGLLKHMESTDRAERREAFEAWATMYAAISDQLDALYDKLVKLRVKKAGRAGFASYIDMAYLSRLRFDYTPADAAAFREQVRTVITPIVDRMCRQQAKRLGVDKLHFYDENLTDPNGNAVPTGDRDALVAAALTMYRELSPETGAFFSFMTEHQLFDLQTRPGKRMGGYCTSLPDYQAPFIFSNFNGTSADVDVLTHEAGHAFQAYLCMRSQPLNDYVCSTSEIDEIHSMAMEHFAYPWMELLFGDKADQYRAAHLRSALSVIPYQVSVDEFQHRVFENPSMSARERRAMWRDIERAYMPWRDYDGNAFLEEGGFWMQKQHVFLYPFYYIDYALAQICAFQLFARMRTDRDAAWADYLALCRAGGSKGYFELLKLANLKVPMEAGVVQETIDCITDLLGLDD